MITSVNGYSLTIAADKLETLDGKKMAASEVIFNGNGQADDTAPAVVRATYDNTDNTITLKFDKLVSEQDFKIKEDSIVIKGSGANESYTLTEDAYTSYNTGTVDTIKLTVPASVKEFTLPLKLEFVVAAFEGANGTATAAANYNVVSSAAPTASSASFDELTNKLTFVTNKEIKVADVKTNLIDVSVNGGAYSALTNSKVTVDGTTVTITVDQTDKFEANTVTSANIKFKAGALTDADTVTNIEKVVTLAYTDDKTAPSFVGASYNDLTKEFVLEFNEMVDLSSLVSAGTIADGALVLSGKQADGSTNITGALLDSEALFTAKNNKKVVIDVATGADQTELFNATEVKLSIPKNTVKDEAGNYLPEVQEVAVAMVDNTRPSIATPTGNADVDAISSQVVNVKFDDHMDKATAENVQNYTLKQTNLGVNAKPVSAILLADKQTVQLTFADAFQNASYGLDISENVLDTAGNKYLANTTAIAFDGDRTTDTTGPNIKNASSANTGVYKYTDNGDHLLGAGDTIELTFNEPIVVADWTKITKADFVTDGTDLGSKSTFALGSAADKLLITLGSDANLAFGNYIDVATTNDILDAAGNKAVVDNTNESHAVIANPGVAPVLQKAVYADVDTDGAVSEDDTITLTFDRVVQPTSSTANLKDDFSVGGALDLGGGAAATPKSVKVEGKNVVVTLGATTPAVAVPGTTDKIGMSATGGNINITDVWGVSVVADNGSGSTHKDITSDDKSNPTFTSIVFNDTNADKVLDAGETVVITMSEPVHKHSTFAAGDFVLFDGATANPYAGKGGSAADGSDVSVSGNVVTITIASGDGWATESVTSNTTFNFDSGTTSLKDAANNNAAPLSGFGNTITIK